MTIHGDSLYNYAVDDASLFTHACLPCAQIRASFKTYLHLPCSTQGAWHLAWGNGPSGVSGSTTSRQAWALDLVLDWGLSQAGGP
jgi:hypothetical protein